MKRPLLALVAAGTVLCSVAASARPPVLQPPPEPPAGARRPTYQATTTQAIAIFRARVKRDPADFLSLHKLGQLYERRFREEGDLADLGRAEAALRRSLQHYPEAVRPRADLAAVLCAQHRFADGLQVAGKLHRENPRDVDGLAILFDALVELGRYAEARRAVDDLQRLSPSPAVLARKAALDELHGRLPEAISAMRQAEKAALGAGPEAAAWYRLRLGDLTLAAGDLPSAERHYRSVSKKVDPHHDATFGLGRVELARGRLAPAARFFQKAIDIGPDPAMLVALAEVREATGDRRAAAALYARFDRATRGEPTYRRERALFLADTLRDPQGAVRLARQDMTQRGGVHAQDALAWALSQAGRSREAKPEIERALTTGTRDARVLYHAGVIYHRLGDRAAAAKCLRGSLARKPGFSPLQVRHLKRLVKSLNPG